MDADINVTSVVDLGIYFVQTKQWMQRIQRVKRGKVQTIFCFDDDLIDTISLVDECWKLGRRWEEERTEEDR
jgi:hypothetical protein